MQYRTGALIAFAAALLSAQEYRISGVIENQADVPVNNLTVRLAHANLADTTDANGTFFLKGSLDTETSAAMSVARSPGPVPVEWEKDRFLIDAPPEAGRLSIDLFSLRGEKIATVFNGVPSVGRHAVSLNTALPLASHSILVAAVTAGSSVYRFKLLTNGGQSHCSARRVDPPNELLRVTAARPTFDTLMIFRKDSLEYAIPVTSIAGRFEIRLDLRPYEITEEVAMQEVDRGPRAVGAGWQEQTRYPYDLWRYLTGPNDAWCSEFLCWAYRCAGYPLGSDAGSSSARPRWLIKGNTGLRSWFQNRGNKHEWVDRSSPKWETFAPVCGDFVRYNTSSGGHTGIVRYVRGTTLHTIEGNVGNRCKLRTIHDYKHNASIDGFGRRSGVRGNSYRLVK